MESACSVYFSSSSMSCSPSPEESASEEEDWFPEFFSDEQGINQVLLPSIGASECKNL